MEQVPNIAMFLHESRPNFPAAFSRYLVPIVVRYLTDPNNQVGFKSMLCLHYWELFLFILLILISGAKNQPSSAAGVIGTGPPLKGRHGDQSLSSSAGPNGTQLRRWLQNWSSRCKTCAPYLFSFFLFFIVINNNLMLGDLFFLL